MKHNYVKVEVFTGSCDTFGHDDKVERLALVVEKELNRPQTVKALKAFMKNKHFPHRTMCIGDTFINISVGGGQ